MLSPFFFPVTPESFNFVRVSRYLSRFEVLMNAIGLCDLWQRDFVWDLVLVLYPSGEMASSGDCP